jgi:hypothetical protein
MGPEHAAMVFTDLPYNVPIDGHASGLGAIHHRPFPMASGEMDKAEFTGFLAQACRNLAVFSVGGSLHFVCMDWRPPRRIAGGDAYGELKNSAAELTATTSSSASLAATAAMCGIIPGSTPSPAASPRAICWRCTRR